MFVECGIMTTFIAEKSNGLVAGGNANEAPVLQRFGGGMLNLFASPKVGHCTFYDNTAVWGGAMANIFAAPRIVNCAFLRMEDDPYYSDENLAVGGGAIANWGGRVIWGDGPLIEGCTFDSNWAILIGGGVYNFDSPMELVGSRFSYNESYAGGGVANWQTFDWIGGPFVGSCEFSENITSLPDGQGSFGGAFFSWSGENVSSSRLEMENCLFHHNATGVDNGSAMVFHTESSGGQPMIVNCTIADNETGGIAWDGIATPFVTNSILWNNGTHEILPDCDGGAAVTYSDVMGGGGCEDLTGNISEDPKFDSTSPFAPFSIQSSSPCVDTANPLMYPVTDITGAYRVPPPDMGAYEHLAADEEEQ